MPMTTLSSRINETRQTGACRRCGRETVLFVGKLFCDACVERQDRDSQRQQAESRLDALVDRGLLDHGTKAVRFEAAGDWGENAAAYERARAEFPVSNLWLYGPAGVGKSYLGRCLLTEAVLEHGYSAGEVSARRLVKIGSRFDEGNGAFAKWGRVKVLLLDDLDKARWTEDTLSALWELLDSRARHKANTIVTANLTPGKFVAFLRERIGENQSLANTTLDRLKPLCSIEMRGLSRRGRS